LRPTHLDSHLHQHNEWAIGTIVLDLARKNGIGAIRIMRNCRQSASLPTRLYSAMFNARLRRSALARSRYFGDPKEVLTTLKSCREVEIIVHPRLKDGVVVDYEDGPLSQVILGLQECLRDS